MSKYRRSESGRGVTSGIRADPRGFTGMCGLGCNTPSVTVTKI
jgi:hypothetical protein